MSTTLLYHVYNIPGYRYRGTKYVPGGIEFTIEQPRERCCCPACDSENVILKGAKTRRFRAPPIGGKRVTILFDVPRVESHDCGVVRQIDIALDLTKARGSR